MKPFYVHFVLPVMLVTVIIGLIYICVQQSYRTAANDPQIQVSEDIADKLNKGISIGNIITQDTIDIAHSLSLFVAVFNAEGKTISSNGSLNGHMVQPPPGVFSYLNTHDDNEVTWQPAKGVRMALVIKKTIASPLAFVAAGRSLKQTELREYALRITIIISWVICFILLVISALAKNLIPY